MIEQGSRRPHLTSLLTNVIRFEKLRNRLVKAKLETPGRGVPAREENSVLCHDTPYKPLDNNDIHTGERRDATALLHSLICDDFYETPEPETISEIQIWQPPGENHIAKLSSSLLRLITNHLSLCDIVCLTISSKTLLHQIGDQHWSLLQAPKNKEEKIRFLMFLDELLPNHLLCYSCAIYHYRKKIGNECLKSTMVPNSLYNCNGFKNLGIRQPETRLTSGNMLPFSFVQLVTRAQKYSLRHGISVQKLNRRYKDSNSEWHHQTHYHVHQGHLLVRVTSQTFAAPGLTVSGQRHLLYSRDDYWPYFSCCAHWRDGELLKTCKHALSHIPNPPINTNKISIIRQKQNSSLIGILCSFCRQMRRCPKCPTEYLVELKLSEDRQDPVVKFKQSISITRWSDLGDGSSPYSIEWAAINKDTCYDSFAHIGKRTISAIFEAKSGVMLPTQRLISINPENKKRGEDGDDWY